MWNDQETAVDLLGHRTLAKAITELIHEDRLAPLTIGIFGDWGAGKSSVLSMVCTELSKNDRVCCITFNGWLFQGYEDAKSALMEAIVTELQALQPWNEQLKTKAVSLLRHINWLKLAKRGGTEIAWLASTGVPSPTTFMEVVDRVKEHVNKPSEGSEQEDGKKEELKEFLNEKVAQENSVAKEIHSFRKGFEELLETAKVDRLVILIDDLDRCMPKTAIETLEAMKLFFFAKGTVFVLAADEEMIVNAVRQEFPTLAQGAGQMDYTRNYLEKLIQVPFRIPPMGKAESRTYITLLLAEYALQDQPEAFEKILDKAAETFERPWLGKRLDADRIAEALGKLPDSLKQPLLLADRITNPLTEILKGNPRQLKRFLNTLLLRRRVATAQGIGDLVHEDVLAKLMLLERFSETTFKDLAQRVAQSPDGGRVDAIKALESSAREGAGSKRKAGKGGSPPPAEPTPVPSEWAGNEWLISWARMEPALGEVDLRPYIYISRERSPGFVAESGLGERLEELARKLTSGSEVYHTGVKPELRELSSDEARKLFAHLIRLAREAPDWKARIPLPVEGLRTLCSAQTTLGFEDELLNLFEGMPATALGAWAVVGMNSVLTSNASKDRFQSLLKKWESQQENPQLSRAVTANAG